MSLQYNDKIASTKLTVSKASMSALLRLGLLSGCVLATFSGRQAHANLLITPIYTDEVAQGARDVINQAISFYNTNFSGNVVVNIGVGSQGSKGGASATATDFGFSYNSYLRDLRANKSESATDVSALASLPSVQPVGAGFFVNETLAAQVGLAPLRTPDPWSGSFCKGNVTSCIAFSGSLLTGGTGGAPNVGLFSVAQQEINEVLGFPSGLKAGAPPAADGINNTTIAARPSDLFRYTGPGAGTFTNNADTSVNCTASPRAIFSIDGGTTALAEWNNCDNGGDYGDFTLRDPKRVEAYSGPDDVAGPMLTLTSPEVIALDALGYNLVGSTVVATGTGTTAPGTILSVTTVRTGGPDDGYDPETEPDLAATFSGGTAVPEPGSLLLLTAALGALGITLRGRHTA